MAEMTNILSKSTEHGSVPEIRCRYLYHTHYVDHGCGVVAGHVHPFWHIDFMRVGEADVDGVGGVERVGAGQCVVIPAGVRHGFRYRQDGVGWLSVKFQVRGHPPMDDVWVRTLEGHGARLFELLVDVLPVGASADATAGAVAAHLLAAFLSSDLASESAEVEPSLPQQLEQLVHERGGRPLTVEEAAAEIGYSASRLCARCREASGVSPKVIIDRARAAIACQRLRYSDESVGGVARALGFVDIYAFSRFFKRLCEQSPTAFRREYHS